MLTIELAKKMKKSFLLNPLPRPWRKYAVAINESWKIDRTKNITMSSKQVKIISDNFSAAKIIKEAKTTKEIGSGITIIKINHIAKKTFGRFFLIIAMAGTPYTRHGFSDIIQSIWATQNTTIALQAM